MKQFLLIILLCVFPIFAQTETLTNAEIIEMTKAGLGQKVILDKIKSSNCEFDSSAKSLIELKKAGVEDEIISEIIEKAKKQRERITQNEAPVKEFVNYSESQPSSLPSNNQTPLETLRNAKTIAIKKSSLHPARQNLEKALLKREDWRKYNLTLTEFPENADLYIDIGRVPLTLVTHRYVFRIFDTRSGVVITAGETTSWGSLADNLARNIIKSLKTLENNK
ncbi:MAG: hypothetical protein AAB336_10060 [Acidobacteriota bacterium]